MTKAVIYIKRTSQFAPARDASGKFIHAAVRDVNGMVYEGRELTVAEFNDIFPRIAAQPRTVGQHLIVKIYEEADTPAHEQPPAATNNAGETAPMPDTAPESTDDAEPAREISVAPTPTAPEQTKQEQPATSEETQAEAPASKIATLSDDELRRQLVLLKSKHAVIDLVYEHTGIELDGTPKRPAVEANAFDALRKKYPAPLDI